MPENGMRNEISRRRALQLTGSTGAVMIAGCSGDGEGDGDTDGQSSDGSSGETTIRMLTHFSNAEGVFNEIINGFEEEHSGVTVQLEQVPPQDLNRQFSTSLGTPNEADMWGKGPGPGELGNFVDRDIPLDLTEHLSEDIINSFANTVSCRYEGTDPLSWRSPDGELYGLPMVLFGNNYWYNKEVLADVGIAEDDIRTRTDITWEEFRNWCSQAKDAGYTPIVMGGSDNIKNLAQWVATTFPKQVGIDTWMETVLGRNDRSLNEEPFVEALAKYQRLYEDEYINQSVTSITRAQSVNNFYEGEALFYFQGSYLPVQIDRMVGEDAPGIHEKVGYFWHPYYPDAYENGQNELFGFTGDVMSLNQQALENRGHTEEAVELFRHFFSQESQNLLFSEAGMGVARSDAWTDLTPEQEIQKEIIDQLGEAEKTYPLIEGTFLPESREAFFSGIGELFSDGDPQDIMDNVAETHEQALEEFSN